MKIRVKLITAALGLLLLGAGSLAAQDVVSDKVAEKAQRQALIDGYKADIKAIKNDPSLTDEQKEVKIKEVRQEMIQKHGKRKKYRPGQGKDGERSEEIKAAREAVKRQLQAIDENSSLTEAEKIEAKKQLREEKRAEFNERKGAKVGSNGNGKGSRKGSKKQRVEKLNERIEAGLSEEEKKTVLKRLDKLQGNLDKQLSNGKISDENYNKRKAEIEQLRSKI